MATFGDFHNVTGAGWSVYWRIPQQVGGGMEVWWADFHGRRVMWKGSQPLAIVPYHTPVPAGEPPGPEFCYKDGLGPECGGAAFTALKSSAPNADLRGQPGWHAAVDTEAVDVHVEPASSFDPRALVITAKFQCGWYQYVQRWEFDGYGEIHPHLGMGGALNPSAKDKSHVHHMYFRIDLDIDGFSTDVFEVFRHVSFDDTAGGDQWTVESSRGKHLVDPKSSRKFRIRDLVSAVGPGHPTRGYEIEIPSLGGTDAHSTADIWATVYRGDSVETGEDVGPPNCGDAVIDKYATGPLDTVNGSDVVAWIVVRHHHEARETTEEANFLPYHYEGFEIMPRGFEVFEKPRQPREPRPPGRAARRR